MHWIFKEHKKSILGAGIFIFLAVAMWMKQSDGTPAGVIVREKPGGAIRQEQISYKTGDGINGKVELEIHPQECSEREAKEYVQKAVKIWEREYLGENSSEMEVYQPLNLPEQLLDGMVTVTYESSDIDVLQEEGTIAMEHVPEEGIVLELQAKFSCQNYSQTEIRSLQIVLPPVGSAERLEIELARKAEETEQNSRKNQEVALPDEIGENDIFWMKPGQKDWMMMLAAGGVFVLALEWKKSEVQKKEEKARQEKLRREYPQLVEQLALLIGSGMTIRRAWERILHMEERFVKHHTDQPHLFGKEMWITYQEIQKGYGEREAYEHFGRRIGIPEYRRLASLLTRNLEKGTRDLCELLTAESQEAWENRKYQARKLGEEAGMKLLFPMILLFLLILIILLYPALQKF